MRGITCVTQKLIDSQSQWYESLGKTCYGYGFHAFKRDNTYILLIPRWMLLYIVSTNEKPHALACLGKKNIIHYLCLFKCHSCFSLSGRWILFPMSSSHTTSVTKRYSPTRGMQINLSALLCVHPFCVNRYNNAWCCVEMNTIKRIQLKQPMPHTHVWFVCVFMAHPNNELEYHVDCASLIFILHRFRCSFYDSRPTQKYFDKRCLLVLSMQTATALWIILLNST